MKEGPDISQLAALIGDPARANILTALMSGKALTAGELATEAGITPATASSHLAKLSEAALIWPRKQGRHRYYALRDAQVAHTLEALAGLAASKGHLRSRPGPKDEALREARVCYDHLAGARAVQLFDSMAGRDFLQVRMEAITLSGSGEEFMSDMGIDVAALRAARRPLCRVCLDWSERRSHLSGALGAALLQHILTAGWARRIHDSRGVVFSDAGMGAMAQLFPA